MTHGALGNGIESGAMGRGLGVLVAFLSIVLGASETRSAVLADDQVGTVLVTVVDQTGAPVAYADIVTIIEGFDFSGHSMADAGGHATKSLLAGRKITICADYNYLHGACGPGFVLAQGETRTVTIILNLAGVAVGTPTPETSSVSPTPLPSRNAPSPTATPSPAAPTPVPVASPLPSPISSPCQFVLGFKTLHDLLSAIVGDCLDDEAHSPLNGDGLQHTTKGLLVWRKADNVTAFTDGFLTWVSNPQGLRERLNTRRFAWEANPDGLPLAP